MKSFYRYMIVLFAVLLSSVGALRAEVRAEMPIVASQFMPTHEREIKREVQSLPAPTMHTKAGQVVDLEAEIVEEEDIRHASLRVSSNYWVNLAFYLLIFGCLPFAPLRSHPQPSGERIVAKAERFLLFGVFRL